MRYVCHSTRPKLRINLTLVRGWCKESIQVAINVLLLVLRSHNVINLAFIIEFVVTLSSRCDRRAFASSGEE